MVTYEDDLRDRIVKYKGELIEEWVLDGTVVHFGTLKIPVEGQYSSAYTLKLDNHIKAIYRSLRPVIGTTYSYAKVYITDPLDSIAASQINNWGRNSFIFTTPPIMPYELASVCNEKYTLLAPHMVSFSWIVKKRAEGNYWSEISFRPIFSSRSPSASTRTWGGVMEDNIANLTFGIEEFMKMDVDDVLGSGDDIRRPATTLELSIQ